MNKSILTRVRNRILRYYHLLRRRYHKNCLRNAILAMQSPKPADRLPPDCRRFAIFLVPGWDFVNGGIMSICSIATETRKLLGANGVTVAVCTALGQPRLLRYTKFDNDVELFAFSDMLRWFPESSEVLVHVPEFCAGMFVSDCLDVYRSRPDLKWRFNILLQNIDRVPSKNAVNDMKQLGFTTITIAHKASAAMAQHLDCPVHYLSWFISAEDFRRIEYPSKKKLVAISPDTHPEKAEIVRRISAALPDHKIIEIRKMTYQRYKEVIRDAKFMFTFGEGLDGYFVESIFSGAVAMAIFAERYFTPEYRELDGVFRDGKTAISSVTDFLKTANSGATFRAIAEGQYNLVVKTFRRELYWDNVKTFYAKYLPEWSTPIARENHAANIALRIEGVMEAASGPKPNTAG
jgi:hypothetical protein